jgi:transcriptional regulator with PAS, ATPase and Fis domain
MSSAKKIKILCADDEFVINDWEKRFKKFFPADFEFIWTQYSNQVLPLLEKENDVNAVILDLEFKDQDMNGKDVLTQIGNSKFKNIPVIIFTVDDSPKTFLEISGLSDKKPYDYIIKHDIDYEDAAQLLLYAAAHEDNPNFLKGDSENIRNVKKYIKLFAEADQPKDSPTVLILGDTGTGKELVAKSIHKLSPLRNDKPFIAINIAAIPPDLIESELFGHKKGSFTGAINDRVGAFKSAKGGVLFLDEIGELPTYLQVKLLRALQEKTILPVGADKNEDVSDVRVIAATNIDIPKYIENGKFRKDLFYRLDGCRIELSSLSDRKRDIKVLVRYFLFKYHYLNQEIRDISNSVIRKMEDFDWDGNVRQLEKMMEKGLILSRLDKLKTLDLKHFPDLDNPQIISTDFELADLRKNQKKIAKKIWNDILSGKRDIKTLDEIDHEFPLSLGSLVGMEAIKQCNGWLTQEQEEKYFGYQPSKSKSSRHLVSYFRRRGMKSDKEILKS